MNRSKGINRLFLAMVLISIVSPFIIGSFLTELTFYQSASLSQLLFLVPVLVYVLATRGEILNELQLQLPKFSTLLLVAALTTVLLPVMTWLNMFSMLFAENYVSAGMTEVQDASLMKNLMYIALVPALSEEFMFRGIFYHGYRPAGVWKAALCSGFCFGLIHMNLNQFCYAFVLGVIFALLVEATGSLICAALAHFLINGNSVWLLALQRELLGPGEAAQAAEPLGRQEILQVLGVYTVIALVSAVLAYGVLRLIARSCGRGEHMRRALGKTHIGESRKAIDSREGDSVEFRGVSDGPERDGAEFRGAADSREAHDKEAREAADSREAHDKGAWEAADSREAHDREAREAADSREAYPGTSGNAVFTSAENRMSAAEDMEVSNHAREDRNRAAVRVGVVTPCLILAVMAAVVYMVVIEFLPI